MKEKSAGCGRGMRSEAVRPGQGIGGKQHKYAGPHTASEGEVHSECTWSVGLGPKRVLLWARDAPNDTGREVGISKAATPGLVGPDEGGLATPGSRDGCWVPEEALQGARVSLNARGGRGG